MPGADLTTVNGILKEVYEGGINNQLQEERTLMKRIEKTAEGTTTDAVGGKYVVFPVRVSRNGGISYRSENAQLAAAGKQGLKSAQETLRYGYIRVRLTGQLIELASSKPQAFADAMDVEMDGAKDDVLKDENRIGYGHMDSTTATGIKAKVTANSAGTTLTVDSTNHLDVDMVIDVVAAGTPVSGGTAKTITAILTSTTFTVDVAIAGAVIGNYVVRTGDWDKEPYGLSRIVDSTGVLHLLDPATTPVWKSVEDASTATLTETAMITNADNARRAGGKRCSAIFCSFGVRRAYFGLLLSLRRYNEPKEFPGGLVGLSFNYGKDVPVVEDVDCPDKHMFGVTEGELKVWRDERWHWDQKDNSILKWVTDFDAYEALMKQYWQFGTHSRNSHWKMTNITEPTA
jgi:hypothetical protein